MNNRLRPRVIAHRGASAAYPENTVAAFIGAVDLGADAVEFDARRTADGQIVIHHDAHLPDGRTIVATAAADLPSSVPSLVEALDACGDLMVNIEIKNWPGDPDFDPAEAIAAEVVRLAGARVAQGRWIVSSFHLPTIDRVRLLDPGIATGLLHAGSPATDRLAQAVAGGHRAVHPWNPLVDEAMVAAAHAAAVEVNVWTVDDAERIRQLAAWGVDGVVTNVPDIALRALDGLP
jgi:glycerophosphoryl diester phosphodiesterase